MLPDFPDLKRKLERKHKQRFRDEEKSALGIFGRAKEVVVFEGLGTEVTYEDGFQSKSDRKHAETQFSFSNEQLENLSEDGLNDIFKDFATKIAARKSEEMWKVVNDGIERVGNVVAHNQDTIESMFEGFVKIQLDFDANGMPHMPEFVAGPETLPKLAAAWTAISADPQLRARFEAIMVDKKEEWRARESRRRLVG